ncbi:SpaA isopeptide-forming pilin-related protein, partial [Clostridium perfringens]|nr:SpaA isopeptide-forming pilin-related protein [Clostridium perfringens]
KTGELDFSKTDLTTGKNVEGAKIEIVGLDEQNKHIKLDFTSSIEGNRFTLPEGNYEFKETQAPKGYKLSTEVGKFEIKGGEVTKAELKNERIVGKLTFNKTDVTTGETIDGAKIKIEC